MARHAKVLSHAEYENKYMILLYTKQSGFYSLVNSALREGNISCYLKDYVSYFNSFLNTEPRETNKTLWRGINDTPDNMDKYVPGKRVHWAAFSSASGNREYAADMFALEYMIKIKAPFAKSVKLYSQYT
eukprot:UN09980